jgi:hypothetical protein
MTSHRIAWLAAALLPAVCTAADFAAKGARGVLSAEYVYTANGRKADKYDSHEWRVKRSVSMSSELVAEAPASLPRLQAPDAQQMGRIDQQRAQAEKMSRQMAPAMSGVEALLAKCGEDEACIEREAVKMGNAMAGQKQTREVLKSGAETSAVMQPGALRYQAWQSTSLSGSYQIDEHQKFVTADPLCMERPGARCHREVRRSGAGAVPPPPADTRKQAAAGFAATEFDTAGKMLYVRLPVPLNVLPCTEAITTDMPGASESGTPLACQHHFQVAGKASPFTVALQPGSRAQSGERTLSLEGGGPEGGQLVVRWQFVPR